MIGATFAVEGLSRDYGIYIKSKANVQAALRGLRAPQWLAIALQSGLKFEGFSKLVLGARQQLPARPYGIIGLSLTLTISPGDSARLKTRNSSIWPLK